MSYSSELQEKKKCKCCNKKITTMNFKCIYCNDLYCVNHRLPEDHECIMDYKNISKSNNKIHIEASLDNHNYIKI